MVKESSKTQSPTDYKKTTKETTAKVYNLAGEVIGEEKLVPEIFSAPINRTLEALSVRVYLANQRQGQVSTKTRGEVTGSTRKLYRQKGTGRSRQGSIRAPHRVGGGVVFGPKPRDFSLKITKKSKRLALFSALTDKLRRGELIILKDLEKIEPKTKTAVELFSKLPIGKKKLVVTSNNATNLLRATSNLKEVSCLPFESVNSYEVLRNNSVIFSKASIDLFQQYYLGKLNGKKN